MKSNIAKKVPQRYDCIAVEFIELLLNLQKKLSKASLKLFEREFDYSTDEIKILNWRENFEK